MPAHLRPSSSFFGLTMEEKQVNIEINVPAIALTACIWAPASITMRELAEALQSQLRLDQSYRVLEIEADGTRTVLSGAEVLKDLPSRGKDLKFYLQPETQRGPEEEGG